MFDKLIATALIASFATVAMAQGTPESKPAKPVESKPAVVAPAKEGSKEVVKPAVKAEAKADSKAPAKAEVKAEVKPESKPAAPASK